jgi:Ca2+-binding RTX toxin-like protein
MGRKISKNLNATGTGGDDRLLGSDTVDTLDGAGGNDFLNGLRGNDSLTGGAGADTFVLASGGGHDVITDFNPVDGDRILFDFGTYSDYMVFGKLADGQTWSNFTNTATFTVNAEDVNRDGVMDTVIQVNNDSVTILNWAPDQLSGWCLYGG